MLIEEGTPKSPEDPLPILFPDPEESKGFQPFLFSDRPLTCDHRDNFYLPSSLFC